MAWIANSIAFGLGATLNNHYPRLIQEFDWSPRIFGLFLGGIFLMQSLTFVIMRLHPHWWRFQRSRLYGAQALMILAVVALPFADLPRVLVSAAVFGFGLGICYYSSIYYSLHTRSGRGRNAGFHESLVGLGSMLIPFLGGWAARATGLLAAPYMIAGVMVGIALLLQELVFQRGRPPSS
jgi:MFS family permease